MSCRRISRELLERFRFGELDGRHAGHLDHLEHCAACREAVGLDQALVRQLRRAMRERVESASPSSEAWPLIRQRVLVDVAAGGRWPSVRQLSSPLRAMAAAAALLLITVFSTGQVNELQQERSFAPRTIPGFVESSSIPPQRLSRARPLVLNLPPQARSSGATALADASSAAISLPDPSEPAARFFR